MPQKISVRRFTLSSPPVPQYLWTRIAGRWSLPIEAQRRALVPRQLF